jgi:hypothetical protein
MAPPRDLKILKTIGLLKYDSSILAKISMLA